MSRLRLFRVLIPVMVFLVTSPAFSGDTITGPGGIRDHFTLSLGFFFPFYGTDLKVNSMDHGGTPVDFENDLGFKTDDSVFRFDGRWRMTEHQALEFAYFTMDRSSHKAIDHEIEWEDYVFNVGVELSGQFDVDVYKIQYRYYFIEKENYEIGAGAGLSIMDFSFGLSGEATLVGEGLDETVDAEWKESVLLPIPALALNARWAIKDNLFLCGSGEFLKGSYDGQEATYSDVYFSIDWYPWKNVGIGLLYDFVKIYYGDKGHDFRGRIDYKYNGPVLKVDFIF